ncbi:hypothetical protein JCM10599A_14190 [Paraburkholderia kururiensis]
MKDRKGRYCTRRIRRVRAVGGLAGGPAVAPAGGPALARNPSGSGLRSGLPPTGTHAQGPGERRKAVMHSLV